MAYVYGNAIEIVKDVLGLRVMLEYGQQSLKKTQQTYNVRAIIQAHNEVVPSHSSLSGHVRLYAAVSGSYHEIASYDLLIDYVPYSEQWTSIVTPRDFQTFTVNRQHSALSYSLYAKYDLTDKSGSVLSSTCSVNVTAPAKPSYVVSYNANSGSGVPSSQTKWYGESLKLATAKPTRTGYTFAGWNTKSDGSGTSYSSGGSYTANAPATLYAVWQRKTYTVAYNANGGSGAPSSQTKIYGTALTLSSTKPTRTGYTFAGWNTESDGSGTSYSSGGSYTANAAATLYAKWTKVTYQVTYAGNAPNGATVSNVPASQTKEYGKALTLRGGKPTSSKGYGFVGWATSASGAVKYQPSASYTANASLSLYAKWQADPAPSVTSLRCERCNSDGTLNDEGKYAKVSFDYAASTANNSANKVTAISYELGSVTASSSPNAKTGSESKVLGTFAVNSSFAGTVTLTDSNGRTRTASIRLRSPSYPLDVMENENGYSVGIGMPAVAANATNQGRVDVGKRLYFRDWATFVSAYQLDSAPSDPHIDMPLRWLDASDNLFASARLYHTPTYHGLDLLALGNGGAVNELILGVRHSDGSKYVFVTDPSAWREALNLGTSTAANEIVNALGSATADVTDDATNIITQHSDAQSGTYYRRPISSIWNWIKGKASAIFPLLAGGTQLSSSDDLDTLMDVGTYYVTGSSSAPQNAPVAGAVGKVIVEIPHGYPTSSIRAQRYIQYGSGTEWYRKYESSAWNEWRRVKVGNAADGSTASKNVLSLITSNSSGSAGQTITSATLYYYGRVAQLIATMKITSAMSANTQYNVATLDSSIRPVARANAGVQDQRAFAQIYNGIIYVRPEVQLAAGSYVITSTYLLASDPI